MATLRFDTRVEQDPDRVWTVLTDVRTIPDWFPAVLEARFDGEYRHLRTPEGTLKALVVTKNDELRRFQYRFVEGLPSPIEYHLGTIDVLPDGDGSRVVYSQEILPQNLAPIVERAVGEGIAGIARYFAARP
ncbi:MULTISPECIES: SRPBCC family protein [Streptomyces]|uniref:SRPBCC family protein n=1 Tax=Streptomyces cylindrosporus TaxID=2927583 RepID=A0ABS9Y0Z2_9ACTN|nr:SRPBCC family protein [Streptomyces cylindrosporus]MCI3270689.1 SRPBCC family protein [Streptomyces cylindrosporus]